MSIKFTVNRDRNNEINGFTLIGSKDDLDIAFCLSFMRAWEFGRADVTVTQRQIVFTHHGIEEDLADARWTPYSVHPGATYSADVSPDDEEALLELLANDFSGRRRGTVRPLLNIKENERGFIFFIGPSK